MVYCRWHNNASPNRRKQRNRHTEEIHRRPPTQRPQNHSRRQRRSSFSINRPRRRSHSLPMLSTFIRCTIPLHLPYDISISTYRKRPYHADGRPNDLHRRRHYKRRSIQILHLATTHEIPLPELHMLKSLQHPNILPLHRIVLGIVHQDIAPRNILIDPETQQIRLFDFDRAVPLSQADAHRDDVKGAIFTLYEIITEDDSFRRVPFDQQHVRSVQSLAEWPQKCKLDGHVGQFRSHLDEWVRKRQSAGSEENRNWIQRPPDIPPPSPIFDRFNEEGEAVYRTSFYRRRRDMVKQKKLVVRWERPAQGKVV